MTLFYNSGSRITGSLFGTASWAESSSRAVTASYALAGNGNFTGTFTGTMTGTASYALSASYAPGGGSSSLAIYDEVTLLTAQASSIAFMGAGVTATTSGNNVTVTIPGGTGTTTINSTDTFWQLATTTTYTDYVVRAYDSYTTKGGGYFRYTSGSNTSITNIPGIRIKSANSSTSGYWTRIYEGKLQVDYLGPTHEAKPFSYYGVSQATLNTRYGTNRYTTVDTPDLVAVDYSMALLVSSSLLDLPNSLAFTGGRNYYFNKAAQLPKFIINPSNGLAKGFSFIKIDGNGCALVPSSSNTHNLLERIPANQTEALTGGYVTTKFQISNFLIEGRAPQFSGQTGIVVGPSYGSTINAIKFDYLDRGLDLQFCLNANVFDCDGIVLMHGYMARCGTWTGASILSSNAQSNHTTFWHCRIYGANTDYLGNSIITGTGSAFYLEGSSGIKVLDCIVEGFQMKYGVHFDAGGSPNVYNAVIDNTHVEVAESGSAFHFRVGGGQYTIKNVYNQYPQTLISVENYQAYPQINVDTIVYTLTGSNGTFANTGFSALWNFTNCNMNAGTGGKRPWDMIAENNGRRVVGSISAGGTTVTLTSGTTAGLVAGWKVMGAREDVDYTGTFQQNTSIVSILNSTQFTVSLPALATIAGGAIWAQSTGADSCHPYNPFAWKVGSGWLQPKPRRTTHNTQLSNARCYSIDPLLADFTNNSGVSFFDQG